MNPTQERIKSLHEWLCRTTGPLPLTLDRIMHWEHWLARGHNGPELATVIRYLRREINAGKRNPGALKFTNLITDVNAFEEELANISAQASGAWRNGPLTPPPDAVAKAAAPLVQAIRKVIPEEDLPDLETKRRHAAAQLAALRAGLGPKPNVPDQRPPT